MYDTLPRSMKSELLVRVRDEDPEIQMERQELTRAKSPAELSNTTSRALLRNHLLVVLPNSVGHFSFPSQKV